jgi:hypothetical protein
MINRRRVTLAPVLVAVVALVVPSAAVAAPIPSQVTINYTNPADPTANEKFSGKVNSSKAKCRRDRKVDLQYRFASGFATVGTDNHTSDTGVWKLFHVTPGDPTSGDYRAKVRKASRPGRDCAPDISPTITIP